MLFGIPQNQPVFRRTGLPDRLRAVGGWRFERATRFPQYCCPSQLRRFERKSIKLLQLAMVVDGTVSLLFRNSYLSQPTQARSSYVEVIYSKMHYRPLLLAMPTLGFTAVTRTIKERRHSSLKNSIYTHDTTNRLAVASFVGWALIFVVTLSKSYLFTSSSSSVSLVLSDTYPSHREIPGRNRAETKMRRVYPLPADEAVMWPSGEEIYGHNRLHLGTAALRT